MEMAPKLCQNSPSTAMYCFPRNLAPNKMIYFQQILFIKRRYATHDAKQMCVRIGNVVMNDASARARLRPRPWFYSTKKHLAPLPKPVYEIYFSIWIICVYY